ncbi:MAG: FapA family protein [Bacteroides sp.]
MSENGYFKLASKEEGLILTVYPPQNGKRAAKIDDLIEYAEKKGFADYIDVIKVNQAFMTGATREVTVQICPEAPLPNNEFANYKIAPDKMRVEAIFYPPFEGAGELCLEEIQSDLAKLGVRRGVDDEAIKKFLANKEYFVPYTVARGLAPVEGYDGRIDYKFNTTISTKPKMNEDGTVDFHALDNVNHVKEGDEVAELFPEDLGTPGYDVIGNTVLPKKVKRAIFSYGHNMHVSDDGRHLISDVSGHVTLENDKIFVSNVLELVNVDNSTGDIYYEGNVLIKGNVLTGFSVKAVGDIDVSGLVEGATLNAGGNITLVRGVQGGGRAVLTAGGNIVSKFIESANMVSAGGSIETDSILHSKVVAKGSIIVQGRNGLIVGGDVKSRVLIDCKTIGNEMGTATVVGVGVDPTIKKRIDVLKNELENLGKQKMQLSQLASALRKKQEQEGTLSPDKIEMQQKTMRQMILLEKQINEDKNELEECRSMISEDINARIKVAKSAYVGTKIMFGDQYMFLHQKYDFCQFVKQGADIRSVGM